MTAALEELPVQPTQPVWVAVNNLRS